MFVRVNVLFVGLTEGQPGLPDLQVDGEVCLEAELLQSDVGSRLAFQFCILHVAVEDPCRNMFLLANFIVYAY